MPSESPRAATTGPRNQRKRPGDLTGVQGQKLAAERDEAQEAALAEAAAARTEKRAEALTTVVDYTQGGIKDDAVQVVDVPEEPAPLFETIRVNYPIEEMTFGREVISPAEYDDHGNVVKPAVLGGLNRYDFEEGKQYRVPHELAAHLRGLGYVYDFA